MIADWPEIEAVGSRALVQCHSYCATTPSQKNKHRQEQEGTTSIIYERPK